MNISAHGERCEADSRRPSERHQLLSSLRLQAWGLIGEGVAMTMRSPERATAEKVDFERECMLYAYSI